MKVIIIGASGVGYVAAETISDAHDVLVIEIDPDVADSVKNRLNVSVLNEDGTNPRVLEKYINLHHPDVIISTLKRDDSNLYICMLAKRFKPDIKTVASITNPDYVIKTSSEGYEGVDVIISPELITAEKMYRLCALENAIDYESLSAFGLSMAVFEIGQNSYFIGQIVMNTFNLEECSVFAIYRNDELYFQVDTMEIHVGDRICLMGSEEALQKYNDAIGVDVTSRDIVILGGTIVGRNLATLLANDQKKRYIRIVEKRQDYCQDMSRVLNGVVVVNGDFTEPDIQSSENIFRADCLVTVTNQDDTNLLMCMSGQKYNTNKIISRYLKKEYMDIFMFTGLATIIGYDMIVSNEISKCVMSESKVLLRMRDHDELFFIHDVNDRSKLLNKYYGDLIIPDGLRVIAINRGEERIFPAMDTMFLDGDRVIVFTNYASGKGIAKVFGRNAVTES
ncbi:MAG: hypothetical protein E7Z64_05555 [Thermoplasmata archaeon]|jgi:trk system potassium uptake protein TrkA|nr:hypothetical protein [Thermoplasmata archaeon]